MSDTSNFEKSNKSGGKRKSKIIVGKVYADWCGACKAVKPEWNKLKNSLSKNDVEVVKIEEKKIEPELKNLEKSHGVNIDVTGYPTIFKIVDGKLSYYEKERSADKMKEWVLHEGDDKSKIPNVMYDLVGGKRKIKRTRKNNRNRKGKRKTRGLWGFFFGK
jgi:thiol-disulfide isomerase/thioredoxin